MVSKWLCWFLRPLSNFRSERRSRKLTVDTVCLIESFDTRVWGVKISYFDSIAFASSFHSSRRHHSERYAQTRHKWRDARVICCCRPATITTAAVRWKGRTGTRRETCSRQGRRRTIRRRTSSGRRRTSNFSRPRDAVGPAPIRRASTRGPGTRCRPNGFTNSNSNSSTSAFPARRTRSSGPRPSVPAATSTRAKKVRRPTITSSVRFFHFFFHRKKKIN